ncbi:MAG: lipopolysaccharide biosynthesis protein [Gammaproteobacteria bacterium]
MIIQLAGVPVLLHYWGAQLYGEWLILFAIPAYLSMTDLGFSQSAANDMTAQVARGNRKEALAVFQSLGALVFSVTGIALLLVTVLMISLPLGNWLHFDAMSTTEVRWVLWLLAAEICVRLVEGVNHAGFRSNGDYALHVLINSTCLLVQSAGVWLAALVGLGPLGAAAAWFGVRVLVTPGSAWLLTKRHRWLRFGFARAQVRELRRLAKPSLANLGMPLAQALNIQGMVLVVAAVFGPLAVVTFSTLRTLTRIVVQGIGTLSHAVEPEFAAAYGRADFQLFRRLFLRMLRSQIALALVCAIILFFVGDKLLAVWTHGRVAMNVALLHWLLLSAVASVLWHGGVTALKAANRHVRASAWFVASAALAVMLAWILMRWTGRLADAGLALLVLDTLMASHVLRASWRLISGPAVAAANPPSPVSGVNASASERVHEKGN